MKYRTPFQSFLDQLESDLVKLPIVNQLAFGATCCERAIPNYRLFSEMEGWGEAAVLRFALDHVWCFVEGGRFAPAEARELELRCKAITPDSDHFANDCTTSAQEAAFMVTLLLEWYLDQTPRHGVCIASFARDTIDEQVQAIEGLDPSDPLLERKIEIHPLMREELDRQEQDLSILAEITTPDALRAFRHRTAAGKSNLGL